MGFLKTLAEGLIKQSLVNSAFEKGQRGEPPPVAVSGNAEIQAIYDRAYEQGQKSVLNKTVATITKKLAE